MATAVVSDLSARKHRPALPGELGTGSPAIVAAPRIVLNTKPDASPVNDGNIVDFRTELRFPLEGIPAVFLTDASLKARLELLVWHPARRAHKRDPIRGVRYGIRIPSGFFHPSDIYSPNKFKGTRGGVYPDATGIARTEWLIAGLVNTQTLRVHTKECFAKYFRIGLHRDAANNTVKLPIATGTAGGGGTGNKLGISRPNSRRAFAFRWAWEVNGEVIHGPMSQIVWAGAVTWPTKQLDPVASSLQTNAEADGQYAIAAGFSKLIRLASR